MEMPHRATLPDYLAAFALSEIVRKRFFGALEVPLLPFATQGLQLFWWGCSLGTARGGNLRTLTKMFVGSEALGGTFQSLGLPYELAREKANDDEWASEYLGKVATDGLSHFGTEPNCLLDLFATSFAPPDLDFRDLKQMSRMRNKNIPIEDAMLQGSVSFLAGVSLGATQSELWRRLRKSIYGQREAVWWAAFKDAGGIGPPEPQEERNAAELLGVSDIGEEVALSLLAVYSQQHFPELMVELGVEECLPASLTRGGQPDAWSSD